MHRSAGILLPISSLPSPYGIGCFSQEAYDFVDWLKEAGQTYWQILPLGVTSYGDSPYQSFSAFAGNPYFIDFRLLAADGLLTEAELPAPQPVVDSIDYGALYQQRPVVLHQAADRLLTSPTPAYEAFCEAQSGWLEDYALFMAVKAEQRQAGLADWPDDLRTRKPAALAAARERLAAEVDYYKAVQFFFYTQWNALKAYANRKGIKLVGDIPIYVSPDSSDLWTRPELFQTDGKVHLTHVAGCPPDAFAADGQLWGNPLYDWSRHEAEDFAWWKRRMKHATSIYDVVRIDHFRGFESYWEIPAGSETAAPGKWVKGPGYKLFAAVKEELGDLNIIAEDLGFMTDEVIELRERTGFPGMKILQFAFNPDDESIDSPHLAPNNSVMYTGTHDNNTVLGWYRNEIDDPTREYLARYTNRKEYESVPHAMLRTVFASVSFMAIATMQDLLELDGSARMNFPSTLGGNWSWRMTADQLTPAVEQELLDFTTIYRRENKDLKKEVTKAEK